MVNLPLTSLRAFLKMIKSSEADKALKILLEEIGYWFIVFIDSAIQVNKFYPQ